MRLRSTWVGLGLAAGLVALAGDRPVGGAGAVPQGARHVLSIDADSTVSFVPEAGLAPVKVDYVASIEYIVNTRTAADAAAEADAGPRQRAAGRKSATKPADRKPADPNAEKGPVAPGGTPAGPTAAVDFTVHFTENRYRQNSRVVVQAKMNRARFQGRLMPEAPLRTFRPPACPRGSGKPSEPST